MMFNYAKYLSKLYAQIRHQEGGMSTVEMKVGGNQEKELGMFI